MKGKSLGGMGRSCRFFFSGGMLGNVMHFGCWGEGYADLVFFQEAEVVTRNNSSNPLSCVCGTQSTRTEPTCVLVAAL